VKTTQQTKTNVIARCINALFKTQSFASVISTTYLLGYGDSWFPLRHETHDYTAFAQILADLPMDVPEAPTKHTMVNTVVEDDRENEYKATDDDDSDDDSCADVHGAIDLLAAAETPVEDGGMQQVPFLQFTSAVMN
jgi:hypothetical protein